MQKTILRRCQNLGKFISPGGGGGGTVYAENFQVLKLTHVGPTTINAGGSQVLDSAIIGIVDDQGSAVQNNQNASQPRKAISIIAISCIGEFDAVPATPANAQIRLQKSFDQGATWSNFTDGGVDFGLRTLSATVPSTMVAVGVAGSITDSISVDNAGDVIAADQFQVRLFAESTQDGFTFNNINAVLIILTT